MATIIKGREKEIGLGNYAKCSKNEQVDNFQRCLLSYFLPFTILIGCLSFLMKKSQKGND